MALDLNQKSVLFIKDTKMRKIKKENGLLSLEASIVVTIFLFLMLFLYSFFVVFEARNQMAHALLATTNSLSLDAYENEKMGNSNNLTELLFGIYKIANSNDDGFVSYELWHRVEKKDVDGIWNETIYIPNSGQEIVADEFGSIAAVSSTLESVIKERFIAYLGGGSEEKTNQILERYHIVGGINGVDFTGSYIESGKLYIKITYTLEYEFDFGGLGTIQMEQSACSKIWD